LVKYIVVELETPGDSRTMFRLLIDDIVVGESLTAVQAHLLAGEIFGRITVPRQRVRAPETGDQQESMAADDHRLATPRSLAARVAALLRVLDVFDRVSVSPCCRRISRPPDNN